MQERDFSEELKKLPASPGVYIMRDERDAIMYVGKAVNLHNRVRSYFRKIVGRGPQIEKMVQQIARFEYIVTDSELEALILENNLIKENRPKYNTMLKDDKTYPYIKVTVGEPYPRVLFVRTMKKDKARYFGPYTSSQAVRTTIELIDRMYGLRDCKRKLPADIGKERPCLNYHMGRCCGPCTGKVTKAEYAEHIGKALQFLSGDYDAVIKDLTAKMQDASGQMEFEKAMHYRDLLRDVQQVAQKQKITEGPGMNRDVLGIAVERESADADAVIQSFFIRDGRMIGREHHYMTHISGRSEAEILSDFMKQFYAGTPYVPQEILLPAEPEDRQLLEEWLTRRRGSKVKILIPQRGQKEKMVELAGQNAALVLEKDRDRLRREQGRTIGAVEEIRDLLGIPNADRMEAFDISNISGFANVGSMVVFEKGRPKRSDYRKFRIRSVEGPNDYACMEEVLTRRFRHGIESQAAAEAEEGAEEEEQKMPLDSFGKFPDVLLMDGGRGQVNVAQAVLDSLGIDIPVCGMVKDDEHRTRGLYFRNVELPIEKSSEGFKLITRIQDEAHRFAIEYHRSLRSKAQVHSHLEEIPGLGPARKKALMRVFSSIEEIAAADEETLAQIPELGRRQAQAVYAYFHREETGPGKEESDGGSATE